MTRAAAALALATLVLTAGLAHGQTGHGFGIEVGVAREAADDAQASPVRYFDTYFPGGLTYRYHGRLNRHQAVVRAAHTRFTSGITDGALHVQRGGQVYLAGGYGRRVATLGTAGVFAGFLVDSHYGYRYHRYTERLSEYVGGYFASLNAAGTLVWSGREGRELSVGLSLPVAAFVSQPPYSLKGRLRGGLRTPPAFRRAGLNVAWEHPVARRLAVQAGYHFLYHRVEGDFPAEAVRHLLAVGLVYTP